MRGDMIKSIIRFLIIHFCTLINGLEIIIFDKEHIIDINFIVSEPMDLQQIEQNMLKEYLDKCFKQVHKKDKK